MLSGKMLKILQNLLFSSCVAVFILDCHLYGKSAKIVISSCDGQMKTGDNFGVDYTAINSHCNCTILPKYNGSLIFASTAINENCYMEISILKVNETKLSTTIPCKGPRLRQTFPVTHDDVLYMTSRSVNTNNEQERFLQDITIFGIANSSSNVIPIFVTCGSTLQSSSAKPSDVITKAKHSFFTNTSPVAVSTYSKRDLESIQPPSATEEVPYLIFVAVGSGIAIIAVIFLIIFCIRRRNHERSTDKSDIQLYGRQRNVANGNKELPYNPPYHQFNNEADGGYSTMEDIDRSPCDELQDNPLDHSHQENIKASGAAGIVEEKTGQQEDIPMLETSSMVEDKTGKEDNPMLETGSDAIYAQPNKVSKRPTSEVEDINPTENLYAQVKVRRHVP
ncbi:uncharacterized protein LOC128184608 isoform X1 [Crassostrea angulata]|uniref:uncharacterized protein LOC128184608 isoform X1 n=1 Tax=Magallana angulata TaxID=2784310 RepID=UPI0022B17CDF|nr:uncharacterized protein LOC128184608 isoform X1 [Crassostrea angulata]